MRRGDLLTYQDDPSFYAYFVKEGGVLQSRCNASGKQIAFDCLGPGDACGLEDALSGQPYTCTHFMVSSGVVWRILDTDLRSLFRQSSSFADGVVNYLARRVRFAAERMELLTLEDLPRRVREVLSHLAARHPTRQGSVPLPITQSHLAALVGASRQRTNAVLVHLHRMGILDSQSRHIHLLNHSALSHS